MRLTGIEPDVDQVNDGREKHRSDSYGFLGEDHIRFFPELRNIGNPGLIKLLQQQIRRIYFYDLWKLSQIEVEIFLSLMIFSKKIIAGKGVENNND